MPPGPNQAGKPHFFREMTARWFEHIALLTENALKGVAMKFLCLLLAAALLFGQTGHAAAMSCMSGDWSISLPFLSSRFMSFLDTITFSLSWECARMADHVPPLPPEADKIFQAARALEKRGDLTQREKGEVFNGYKKAAAMGHWKAMNSLIDCYLSTTAGSEKALEVADKLIAMNVPSGWYARYRIEQDIDALRKAAELGEPNALYKLGMSQGCDTLGMRYLICAVRQGHGESAYKIGTYLEMFGNYYMAVEYFYRAVSLGHYMAALELSGVFHPEYAPDDFDHNLGFQVSSSPELHDAFDKYYRLLKKEPGTHLPDLFKKHPLPPNAAMTREQSRAMPSPLKDAFGGKWPDEIYPDLAPDYLPPKL